MASQVRRPVSVRAHHFAKCNINCRVIVGGAAAAYRHRQMLTFRTRWIARLRTALLEHGPYVAIGLALPGGTVLLALLWVFRHRRRMLAQARRTLIIVSALGARVILPGGTLAPRLHSAAGGQSADN
jgi:hypothetical protein